MKYLKVFTDFAEDMEELNDAEAGRLFRAMLRYASSGELSDLRGNERYLWSAAKRTIDNQRECYDTMCETNKRIAASRSVTKRDEASEDKDKDKEKDKEKKRESKEKSAPRFTPPSLDEVKAYVSERNSSVDPVRFWDYYQIGEWKDAKGNPVKNWKQKLLTWEKKDGGREDHAAGGKVPADWGLESAID